MTQKQSDEIKCDKADFYMEDGVSHINTHNHSKTELGKMLAHYYVAPFTHPWFGPFKCMEGFWYYLRGGCKDDAFHNAFRTLNGHFAKKRAKSGEESGAYTKYHVPDLDAVILAANYAKIEQHPEIREALINSTLPFEHYYVFGPGKIVIRPRGADKLILMFEKLRTMFREGTRPEPIDYAALVANIRKG